MAKKIDIVFSRHVELKDHTGKVLEEYNEGKVYSLDEEKAERWLKRVYCDLAPEPEPDEKQAQAKKIKDTKISDDETKTGDDKTISK